MVRWFFAISVAVALSLFGASPGLTQPASQPPAATQPASGGAVAHAARVEQRALQSSFADLDAFGAAALTRNDAEGLSRLQHVT